jgi:hypothetical protein
MDLAFLASKIYKIIKPVILSEVGKTVITDLTDAAKGSAMEIWGKVKPLFIIEDEEVETLRDLKDEPMDPDYEDAFLAVLKAKLKKEDALLKELQAILQKEENAGGTGSIEGSENANTGPISNVGGSVIFGNKNKIGK